MKTNSHTNSVEPYTNKQLMRYLCEIAILGFLIAIISSVAANSFKDILCSVLSTIFDISKYCSTIEVFRAFVFFVIGDLVIVPIYLFRTVKLVKNVKMKSQTALMQKIWLTFSFLTFGPLCIATPYFVLTDGNAYAWRVHFVYDIITTLIGLSLLGGAFLWVTATSLAAAVHFLPLTWFETKTGD